MSTARKLVAVPTENPKIKIRWIIGRRMPLLSSWRHFILITVFRLLKVSDVEILANCEANDKELAEAIASNIEGGFYARAITVESINDDIPLETVSYGPHDFPKSKYSNVYKKLRFNKTSVDTDLLLCLEKKLDEVLKR